METASYLSKNKLFLFLFLCSPILVLATTVLIPWHMDEFIMFHRIACSNPAQQVNIYHESCFDYKVSLLGIEYHKSYYYTGIFSSIIATPFFKLVPSLWTNYFVGGLFLIATAAGLIKSFELPKKFIFLVFMFFPIVFTIVHDGGPVRFSFFVLAWTPFLFKKYLESKNKCQLITLVIISFTWILATEDKSFFIFLIPGLILMIIASLLIQYDFDFLRNQVKKILNGLIITSISPLIFLLVLRAENMSYLLYLVDYLPKNSGNIFLEIKDSPNSIVELFNLIYLKGGFIFNWGYYPHRTMQFTSFKLGDLSISYPGLFSIKFQLATILYFFSLALVIAMLVLFVCWIYSDRKIHREKFFLIDMILVASALIFWFLALLAGGETSHHFAFAYLPIVALALIKIDRNLNRLQLLFGLTLVSSICVIVVTQILPNTWATGSEIIKTQELAMSLANSSSVISYSAWGGYSQYSLLNKNDIPIVSVNEPQDYMRLENDMRRQGKEILNICMACDLNSIRQAFRNSEVVQIETNNQYWQLFRVTPRA